jgi:hypothetical protein
MSYISQSTLENGFLSTDLHSRVADIRGRHADWFSHAENLNRFAQRIVTTQREFSSERGLGDDHVLALLLLYRALNNFQATVLMAERGMIVEARTLARSCLETAIWIAALKTDPEHWRGMLKDELASKRARGRWILKNAADALDPARREGLEKYVDDLEHQTRLRALKLEDVAKRAGVHGVYLFYRQLSADAAHPSITALHRHVSSGHDDEIKEIQWMPVLELDDISETLGLACSFLILACTALGEMFPDAERNKELTGLHDEHVRLAKARQDAPPAK